MRECFIVVAQVKRYLHLLITPNCDNYLAQCKLDGGYFRNEFRRAYTVRLPTHELNMRLLRAGLVSRG